MTNHPEPKKEPREESVITSVHLAELAVSSSRSCLDASSHFCEPETSADGLPVRSSVGADPSLVTTAPLPGWIRNEPIEPASHGRVHPEHQRDPEQKWTAAHQEAGGLEQQPARKRSVR